MNKSEIPKILVDWYEINGRKNLPWQVKDTYYVWISEIMLQQTQVVKVIDYFNNFIQYFPSLEYLSNADVDDVLKHWSGLGYYNRARNIHKTAIICSEKHNNELPNDIDELIALPGIGRTTAGAILSLSLDLSYPILDGNVKRVMSRVFALSAEKPSQLMNKLWEKVESIMPTQNARKYNQSLMDLGSMVCKRSQPNCQECPLSKNCQAYLNNQIDKYPQKNKKVKQIALTQHALMIVNEKNIYLEKRQEIGIWPQLWFLPLFDSNNQLMKFVSGLPTEIVKQFSVDHILTHRKLLINVSVVGWSESLNLKGKWQNVTDFKSIPHPTALKKIMKSYNMY